MVEFATYRKVLDTEKVREYLHKVMEEEQLPVALAFAEMENRMNAGEFYPEKGTQTRFD
jgi:hypothetical protein